jgi:Cytochrome c554 and c-prime
MSKVQKSDETPISSEGATPNRRSLSRFKRWPVIVVAAFFGVIILGGVGFVGATALEEHDDFCASCHTVPETTYFQRATAATGNVNAVVTDLASYHYQQAQAKGQTFGCIECHRGDSSLMERFQTLALGGQDTITFLMGKADPTLAKTTINQPELVNAACVSCHTDTLLTVKGNATHFHNWLPQTAALIAQGKQLITSNTNGRNRLRTVNTTITCTSCHLAHNTVDISDPKLKMMDKTLTQAACDTCHQAAGERPQSLDRLLNGGGEG